MPLSAGDTASILDVSGSSHLNVVVRDRKGPNAEIILVDLTTKRRGSDTTTLLRVGDHPFNRHDSVVYHAHAVKLKEQNVDSLFGNYGTRREKLDSHILGRIQQGLLNSPHTPRGVKQFYIS